jgi:magnesium-transporting ATPase (P-type)
MAAAEEKKEKQDKKKVSEESRRDTVQYYARAADEVLRDFSVDPDQGLTDEEVEKRREQHGPNEIPKKREAGVILLFLKQFKDFLILILFIAAGISLYIGHMTDVYLILGVILFNAIMGFTQEYRAGKAIEAIKNLVKHNATVIRAGEKRTVPASELVPGDIISLDEGQTVPADARLISIKNLQTAEASLTGESEAVVKTTDALEDDTVLADQVNMVWKGTNVVKGSARAVVVATGRQTQIGKIAHTLGAMEKTDSNFRRKTNRLAKTMAGVAISASVIVFCLGYFFRDFEFQDILLVTIATLVSAIPEGLPVVISIVLAMGASRMAEKNAIIREYTATEVLGSVTTILSDKTGTITQGILSVNRVAGLDTPDWTVTGQGYQTKGEIREEEKPVEVGNNAVLDKILTIAAYCQKARLKNEDDTEEFEEERSQPAVDENRHAADRQAEHASNAHRIPSAERVEESRRRLHDDINRLEEDIRQTEGQQEKIIRKDKEFIQQSVERLEQDVRYEVDSSAIFGEGDDDREQQENRWEETGTKPARKPESGREKKKGGVEVSGDPTEIAMLVLAERSRIKQKEPFKDVKVLDDFPFSTEHKFRATLIEYKDGKREMLALGAPEKILSLSSSVYAQDGSKELGEEEKETIGQKHDEWAAEAMRIIAVAHKAMPAEVSEINEEDVHDLTWTGIVGIIDPPREEVNDAVQACRDAGIRVMMVTGDHKITAAAIAKRVGIIDPGKKNGKYPEALSEKDLADLDDAAFDDKVQHVSVFARVSPKTKLRIAERLQLKGQLIAMTGDGVNDALALKKADVGIAMGERGTDVAKDASQIVLSDDNFASIVNAIREGRIIFRNIRNTSYYLLTGNFALASTLIVTLVLGWPVPLSAVQILWVNMLTDGIMDIARSTERGHGEIMKQKPIRKDESILQWEVVPYLVIMVILMVSLTLLVFNYYLPQGDRMARTAAFLLICMTHVFNVFNMRALDKSVFEIGLITNKWINVAFLSSMVMQVAVVKVPFLRNLFGFENFSLVDYGVIVAISSLALWIGELYKFIQRKRKNNTT